MTVGQTEPLANAASWRIAAELVNNLPNTQIREVRDGDEHDVLWVHDPARRITLQVSRTASIRVGDPDEPGSRVISAQHAWAVASDRRGITQLVHQVLGMLGLPPGRHEDRSLVLMYRVIASVLAQRAFDTSLWDAHSAYDEGSDYVGGNQQRLGQDPDLRAVPAADVWALEVDGHPVTRLCRGWAWLDGGDRVDLASAHQRVASLADLAALVTRRPSGPRLPPGHDIPVPNDDADIRDVLRFASTYNTYRRWTKDSNQLSELLRPVLDGWNRDGGIPSWAGVDVLRALLFYEFRSDYYQGGSETGQRRMRTVVAAIRQRSGEHVPAADPPLD